VIEGGPHIEVLGTGSSADPFVIAGDFELAVEDNDTFDLTLTGAGTTASPFTLEVTYAATATLNDLPDVNAPTPSNAEVLGWDSATSQWTPRAPTTASAGSVTTDTSLAGDGSGGAPLQVQEDPDRMLATGAAGLGLSDTGMNSVVRKYADATARTAASPAPVQNALTMLATNPGQIDYWTGSAWSPAGLFLFAMTGQEMFELSGPYTGDQRVTFMVRNIDQITDSLGVFEAISATDLAGRAGVITAIAQPTAPGGPGTNPVPFAVILAPEGSALMGTAYRLDDGEPMALSSITCTVIALLY
jgi:hypothetical protein